MTSIGILSPPLIDVPIVVHVRSGGRPFAAGDWVGLFMLDAAGQAASTSLAVTPPRPLLQEGRVVQDGDVPVGPATLVGSVSRDLSATAHPRESSVMVDPAAGLLATGASASPSAALRAPASAAVVALTPAASPSASRAGSITTSPPPPRAPAAAAVSAEGVEQEERDRSPGVANASQSEDSTSRRRHRDGSALVAAVSPPPASTRGSDRHPSWAVEEAAAGEERRGSGEPRVRQFSSGRPIAWQMLPTGYTAATCSFVLDPRLLDVHRDATTGAIAPVRLALRLVRQMGDAPRAPSPSATTTHGGMHDSQAVDAECTIQLVSPLHAAQVCVRPGFTLDVHFAFTRDDTVIAWHGGATPGAGTPMLHHQHDFSLVHEGSGIEVARGPVVVGCGVLHMPMPRLAGRYLVLLRDPRHQIDLLRYPVEVVTGHDFRLVLAPGAGAIQPTASPIALEIISDLDGGRGRINGAGVDASLPRTESSPTARAAHRARASAINQDAAGASAAASPPPRQPRADVVDVEGGLPASGDADAETPPEGGVESSAFHIEAFTPFDVRVVASHAGAVKHGDELLILRHHGGEVWDPIAAPTARFPLARQDGTWRGIILPPGRFGVALGLRHERAVLIGATHWVVVSDVPPQPQPQPQPQQVEAQQQHYAPQPLPHANGHHHHMHHHGGGGAMQMHEHLAMAPSAAHLHNHPHPAVYLTQGANGVQWQQTPMTLGAIATHEYGYFPVPADMAFRGPHVAQPYMGGAGETRLGSGHAAGPIPAYVPMRTAGAGAAAPAAAMPPTARPWGPLPPAAAPRPAAQYPPFIAELLGTTGAGAAPVAEGANGAEGQAADAAHSMTALAPHHASPVPIDPSARPALRTVDSQVHADGSQTVTTTTYSSSLCMCCYERQMCVMLRPCRHVCLCEDCELQLRGTSDACPICRTTIQASERVFLP